MTLSQELKETYASVGPARVLETLELNHPTFASSFKIVRDHVQLIAGLENGGPTVTFEPFSFNVVQPKKSTQGTQSLQITIDNVSREIIQLIEDTQDGSGVPINVVYRIYLSTETDEPQNDPPLQFTFTNISVNKTQVSGVANRSEVINRKFPSIVYDRRFQSLFAK